MLTNTDIAELSALRRELHRTPELSGEEHATAARIAAELTPLADRIETGIGGTGVVAIFNGAAPGPTTAIRAELDALPIAEAEGLAHRSAHEGVAHLCGHDGHMAILVALARLLARRRPLHGRVLLLFQPAEETGAGAAAMLADPRFEALAPDWALSLHNLPGLARGTIGLRAGLVNCASVGMRIELRGATAHAAQPETGRSPIPALAALAPALTALSRGVTEDADFRLCTVTHLAAGAPAHGIAPGSGRIWVSLRARSDAGLDDLRARAGALAQDHAQAEGLALEIDWHEHFAACDNDAEATALLARAAESARLRVTPDGFPMRASEDFGRFGWGQTKSAMLGLGSGVDQPPLHAENYDFPDDLIAPGAALFAAAIAELNGAADPA